MTNESWLAYATESGREFSVSVFLLMKYRTLTATEGFA